jgi:DNA-binding response OmpR family regulator
MISPLNPRDYKILVVDDDKYIQEVVCFYLMNKGFQVKCASNGKEAIAQLHSDSFHVIVLDIMLPQLDGWEICQKVRQTNDIPIIMLTAKGENNDKIKGLQLGADDYLVKPFDPNELVARVMTLIRRTYQFAKRGVTQSKITFGSLQVNMLAHTVMIGSEWIDLTPREYQLLLILVQHPNQVFERQHLLDLVWGEDYLGEDRVVDVFVTRLRQKLDSIDDCWKIETVRSVGYKFKVG